MTEPASSSPLARARLELRAGELVAEVEILPFVHPAQVVLWGARVFLLKDLAPELTYREAVATVALRMLPPVLEEVAP